MNYLIFVTRIILIDSAKMKLSNKKETIPINCFETILLVSFLNKTLFVGYFPNKASCPLIFFELLLFVRTVFNYSPIRNFYEIGREKSLIIKRVVSICKILTYFQNNYNQNCDRKRNNHYFQRLDWQRLSSVRSLVFSEIFSR